MVLDIQFSIHNNECKEIARNYGWETFQGILFEIFFIEYCMCNPYLDTLTVQFYYSDMLTVIFNHNFVMVRV